jgi:hypothetical protein
MKLVFGDYAVWYGHAFGDYFCYDTHSGLARRCQPPAAPAIVTELQFYDSTLPAVWS